MQVDAARVKGQSRVEYDEGLRRKLFLEVGEVSTEGRDRKGGWRGVGRFRVVWEGKEITVQG